MMTLTTGLLFLLGCLVYCWWIERTIQREDRNNIANLNAKTEVWYQQAMAENQAFKKEMENMGP